MNFLIFFLINVIKIVKYAILVRVLLSWIQTGGSGRFGEFIYELTEPVLRLFRNWLPRTGFLDLSPIIAFIVLDGMEWLLTQGLE